MKKHSIIKCLIFILIIAMLACNLNLIYAIFLLEGIENNGRILIILLLLTIDALFVNEGRRIIASKKKKKHIGLITFIIIYTIVSLIVSLFIKNVYLNIKTMNKDTTSYVTTALTLKDSNLIQLSDIKGKNIGILEDDSSIEGYILPFEIMEKENIETNIKYYDSYAALVEALYNKDVDLIFISYNYKTMFSENDKYQSISDNTKIITTYEKELKKDETITAKNILSEPFTVLLIGVDSHINGINNQTGNGDALVLVTFNPNTLSATMLSIPRDSYVKQACFKNNVENKITHAAWGGTDCIIQTIENFLDIPIDYYIKINFKGIVNLVDELDGITVNVPKSVCTNDSNRSSKVLVCIDKGIQRLNGEQALVLARNRYDFANGDLDRGMNQQLVIEGIINSSKNINSINDATNILNIISNNIDTNFSTNQILSSYNLLKKLIINAKGNSIVNIQKLYLNGEGQTIYDEGMNMALWNYILYPDSVKTVSQAMKENLDIIEPTLIKNFSYSIKEPYSQEFVGKNTYGKSAKYALLPDFTTYTKESTINWLKNNGFSYSFQEHEDTEGQYQNDAIIYQSIPALKRLDKIDNKYIIIKIAKTIDETENTDQD